MARDDGAGVKAADVGESKVEAEDVAGLDVYRGIAAASSLDRDLYDGVVRHSSVRTSTWLSVERFDSLAEKACSRSKRWKLETIMYTLLCIIF